MHFGRAIYFFTQGDVLTVVSPIDWLFCGMWIVGYLAVAALLSIKYGIKAPWPWFWNTLALVAVLSVGTASATVLLDAPAGKVRITRVLFYHPTRETYDLAALQGATVGDSEQTDALRLVFQNGADIQLTPFNQMGGKGQAASAINQFVRAHGGSGLQ